MMMVVLAAAAAECQLTATLHLHCAVAVAHSYLPAQQWQQGQWQHEGQQLTSLLSKNQKAADCHTLWPVTAAGQRN
jgi:hypothetical protein